MAISKIEDVIRDIAEGKMVIMTDDEDRENEGDVVIAAEKITPEAITFMARYACGLICLSLTEDKAKTLNLPLMVRDNTSKHNTAFTVSIEAKKGVTTGISAHDRAKTVQVAMMTNQQQTTWRDRVTFSPLSRERGVFCAVSAIQRRLLTLPDLPD